MPVQTVVGAPDFIKKLGSGCKGLPSHRVRSLYPTIGASCCVAILPAPRSVCQDVQRKTWHGLYFRNATAMSWMVASTGRLRVAARLAAPTNTNSGTDSRAGEEWRTPENRSLKS